MKIGLVLLLFAVPLFPQFSYDNTEGVGVAALGRGGAGIAVAGDPAGVWHNPAGLAQITEAQVALAVGNVSSNESYNRLYEVHYDFWGGADEGGENYKTINDESQSFWTGLEYISIVRPVSIGGKQLVLQAGYRRLGGFADSQGSGIQAMEYEDPDGTITGHWEYPFTWTFDSQGRVDDWGMAGAMQIISHLSLGINFHFLNANYGTLTISDFVEPAPPYRLEDSFNFSGLLWDAGVLWQLHPSFSIGVVYRSGMSAGLDYWRTLDYPDPSRADHYEARGHTGVQWPDGYGLGIAWTPTSQWLVALDYSRMNWSKGTMDELINFYLGRVSQNIGFPTLSYNQKDTDKWRLGAEYHLPSTGHAQWILRAGYGQLEQMVNQMAWGGVAEQPIYKEYSIGAGFKFGKTKWDLAIAQSRGEEQATWTETGGDVWFLHDNSMESRTTRVILSGTVLLD